MSRSSKALARVARGELRVREDIDQIWARLIEAGFEPRSMLASDGKTIPEGVYLTRRGERIVVWVPPDPARSVGNSAVLPTAIELRVEAQAQGRRLRVRPIRSLATQVGVGALVGVALLSAAALAWFGAAPMVWFMTFFAQAVAWVLALHQARIARARDTKAWDALSPVLGELAQASESPAESGYRE